MNNQIVRTLQLQAIAPAPVLLQAEPEPLEIDLRRTAIMVIDMQNAFVSKGGFFDQRGYDTSAYQQTIRTINKINATARAKGVKVIYIAHRVSPDLRETGGPSSGYWHKLRDLFAIDCEDVGKRDNLIFRGTWGAEIVRELKPQEGDILIEKPKFSAFFGTDLDTVLKTFDIKYIAFAGTFTNICVEASLRDAVNLGYFCILISDATVAGTPSAQEATINNVKRVFGWVTTSENLLKAMSGNIV